MDFGRTARDKHAVRKSALGWLLLALVAAAGSWYFTARAERGDRELPVYVAGSLRMAAGEEIYRRGEEDKPFTYPPFAAVPTMPLALAPRGLQPALWFLVNLAMLTLGLRWLHRSAREEALGGGAFRPGLLWLGALLLSGRYVSSVFENQSHDLFVLMSVLGCAHWLGRQGAAAQGWAGVAAGLGGAFKATPLLLLELFVLARSWWAAAAAGAAAAAATLLPDLLFARQDGRSWAAAWYDVNLSGLKVGGTAAAAGAWSSHAALNQGLAATLTRLFSPPPEGGDETFTVDGVMLADLSGGALRWLVHAGQAVTLLALAAAALRFLARAREGAAERRWAALGAVGAVCCGMLLLSPQSSKQHFCILLLPAVFCVQRLLRAERDRALLLLVAGSALFSLLTIKGLTGSRLGNELLAMGAVTWATALLLAASLRALRRR